MRRILVLVLVIAVLTIVMSNSVFAKVPLHQAMGGGGLQFPEGLTYSFTAIQLDADENATGEFRFITRVSSITFQADVKYLSVNTKTSDAWIGAVITKGDEGMEEGTGVVIRVHDSGEGKGRLIPDGISPVQGNVDPAWALDQPLLPMGILVHGNVQVR